MGNQKLVRVHYVYMGMDYTFCLWMRIALVDNIVDAVRLKRMDDPTLGSVDS